MVYNIRKFRKIESVKSDQNGIFTIKNGVKIIKKSFPKKRHFPYKIDEFKENAV